MLLHLAVPTSSRVGVITGHKPWAKQMGWWTLPGVCHWLNAISLAGFHAGLLLFGLVDFKGRVHQQVTSNIIKQITQDGIRMAASQH